MEYKFCNKKVGSGTTIKVKANVNEVLAQELHKPMRSICEIIFGQQI